MELNEVQKCMRRAGCGEGWILNKNLVGWGTNSSDPSRSDTPTMCWSRQLGRGCAYDVELEYDFLLW
jgi:hypothetical protein